MNEVYRVCSAPWLPGVPVVGWPCRGAAAASAAPCSGKTYRDKTNTDVPNSSESKDLNVCLNKNPKFHLRSVVNKTTTAAKPFYCVQTCEILSQCPCPWRYQEWGGKFVVVHINVYYLRKRVQIQTSDSGSPHRAVRMRRKINNLCVFLTTEQEKSFCFKLSFSVRSPLAPCRLCFPSRIDYTVRWVI